MACGCFLVRVVWGLLEQALGVAVVGLGLLGQVWSHPPCGLGGHWSSGGAQVIVFDCCPLLGLVDLLLPF